MHQPKWRSTLGVKRASWTAGGVNRVRLSLPSTPGRVIDTLIALQEHNPDDMLKQLEAQLANLPNE